MNEGMFDADRPVEPLGPPLYSLGDMVWVKIGSHPYWPAMVRTTFFQSFPMSSCQIICGKAKSIENESLRCDD
jgi:hypothetical protein